MHWMRLRSVNNANVLWQGLKRVLLEVLCSLMQVWPSCLLVLWKGLLHSLVFRRLRITTSCSCIGADIVLLTDVWTDHSESPVEVWLVHIEWLLYLTRLLIELRLVRLVNNRFLNACCAFLLQHRLPGVIIIDSVLLKLLGPCLTTIFLLEYLIHSLILEIIHQNEFNVRPIVCAFTCHEVLRRQVVIPDILYNWIMLWLPRVC